MWGRKRREAARTQREMSEARARLNAENCDYRDQYYRECQAEQEQAEREATQREEADRQQRVLSAPETVLEELIRSVASNTALAGTYTAEQHARQAERLRQLRVDNPVITHAINQQIDRQQWLADTKQACQDGSCDEA